MDQPKIERLLRLIKLLTGNVNYTVDEIARKLEMSRRTVYRYIDTLKSAGFVIRRVDDSFHMLKENHRLDDIDKLVHFSEEEGALVNRLIDGLDDTNMLKQNLRRKLSTVYNSTAMAASIVKGKNAQNVNRLQEAIENRCQAVLVDYASSHAGLTRNRVVEPFGFTTNYVQLWCYEPESAMNKLFKVARIGSVSVLDTPWQCAEKHEQGFIDIFRMTGFEQHRVQVKLGMLARNLLIEEYPLAERDIRPIDDAHWMLDTKVCNYIGVGRFVMGLLDDTEIIDSPELEAYIDNIIHQYDTKRGRL